MTQQRCYYHPLRRIRTRYSVGAKIFLLLWAAGLGGTLYSLRNCTSAVRSSINRFCRQCYLHQNRRGVTQ